MAQPFATGAVHIFVQPPGGTLNYFGTTESMPGDDRQPEYEPIMNDMSGSKVPLDFAFEGASAQISLVMTRVEQVQVELLQNFPYSATAGGGGTPAPGPGQWSFTDVGSLMALEGLSWKVWLVNTFGAAIANKAAYVSSGLRPGRRYPQCILWAPQRDEAGTKPMKQHFMLYAWPQFNSTTRRFVLYDYDMSGININAIK